MGGPAPIPVPQPTAAHTERLPGLDFVRGVCVMLMVPAMLPWFCRPFYLWQPHPLPASEGDRFATALLLFFVDHKVLAVFSLLFGIGIGLQMRRPGGQGKPFLRSYLWRMVILLFLGLLHTLLLWWGDVLVTYAIVGIHVVALVNMSANMERLSLFVCFAWFALLVLVVLFLAIVPLESIGGPDLNLPPLKIDRSGPPITLFRGKEPITEKFIEFVHPHNQERIYLRGTWLDRLEFRFVMTLKERLRELILDFWFMLGCALLGRRFVLWGLLDGPAASWRITRWFLLIGVGVGIPLNLLAASEYYFKHHNALSWGLSQLGALPLGLLYLGVLLTIAEKGWLDVLQAAIRAVGRLALTHYLLLSLLGVLLFQSFGASELMPLTAALVVAGGIVVLQLIVSPTWLSFFDYGPMEWLWRSLAARRWLPLRARF